MAACQLHHHARACDEDADRVLVDRVLGVFVDGHNVVRVADGPPLAASRQVQVVAGLVQVAGGMEKSVANSVANSVASVGHVELGGQVLGGQVVVDPD